ncbi:hypothetical protein [Actinomadura decatromicini]|uniref:hypothetical protein n=1 Tax=Actinomadura decatromicini TaxID=2604572 RepID=UPI001653380D|nr:hypothetical protein [Actinomadura decatromicini]
MVAFLRACQVPEEELPAWERAWERAKISQLPQTSTVRTSGAEQNTTRLPKPTRNAREDTDLENGDASDGSVEDADARDSGARVGEAGKGGAADAGAGDAGAEVGGAKAGRAGNGGAAVGGAGSGGAAGGRKGRPVSGWAGRGGKVVRRRLVLPVGLIVAAGLAGAIAISALTDAGGHPPQRLTDDGRAFGSGGSSQFTVSVDPAHTELRLTRRLDAIIAMQTATVAVNGAIAAVWQPLQGGPRAWQDQTVVLPPALTLRRRSLTITNTFVSSEFDFNEFTYFVDQKVGGDWSRADTVNIGPEHPGSEAAHHYRITNQHWAGVRRLDYLK